MAIVPLIKLHDSVDGRVKDMEDLSRVQTAAENIAGVTILDYTYPPGDIRRYGGIGNDSTDNSSAMAALAAVMARGTDGYFPIGIFRFNTGPNWGSVGATLRGERGTILRHTGTGVAFTLDTGLADGNVFDGLDISYLIIEGNSNTTDAFYSRGIVRSKFAFIEVRTGCQDSAFNIKGAVSNIYDHCIISGNIAPVPVVPTQGFLLDENGTGYYTADCLFLNCVTEGYAGKGVTLDHDASGNIFVGGTFEGVSIGLDIQDDGCRRNQFINVWLEANSTHDIRVKGVNNVFDNCYAGSASSGSHVLVSTGTGTLFKGGFLASVELQASSHDTLFVGTAFSNHVAFGIIGGNYKCIGCAESDTNLDITASVPDIVGEIGTFTPSIVGSGTAGTQTYATNGRVGIYTRVGSRYDFSIYLNLASNSGGSGNAVITGLPIATRNVTNAYQVFPVAQFSGVTLTAAGRCLALQIAPGLTSGALIESDSGVTVATLAIGDISGTALVVISGTIQI
jgi:hypothetical protein